jgi:PQQ-dependent dehydrogenase (s-GDH family)
MKKPLLFLVGVLSYFFSFTQAGNNTCATATLLTVSANCTTIQGDLFNANLTNPTGGCGNRADVWYRFVVPANSTSVMIRVTPISPTSISTGDTYIELYNTTNCTIANTTIGGCGNTINLPRAFGNLTPNTTYYFRVSTTSTPTTNSTRWRFNVCVTSNDNCNTATTLVPGTTLEGSVWGASTTGSIPVGCATGTPDDDVWYSFTAPHTYATVTLSSVGSNLTTTARMQMFRGTTCTGLTSIYCGTSANVINATGLTKGAIYYIRVYSSTAGQGSFTANNSMFSISVTPSAPSRVASGRMKEIYSQTILSAPGVLNDPWEVTFGPDSSLWITEAKGYRLYRVDRNTGVRDTVLNLSQGSNFYSNPTDQLFYAQFNISTNNPQGGFAGMALHPKFLDPDNPQNFVYVSYIYSYGGGSSPTGIFYTNRLARFTYNTSTRRLESPVSLCDSLPGSNDHNSQRMIIAPVGATHFLFYASGDMGSGQFNNRTRLNKSQNPNSYEGKILRFNLISDGGAGFNAWIPNDNPYGVNNAVYCIGIRNNQGFAFDTTRKVLYGSSHGPYSDDEVNIIQANKNYGHPLVIGYAADNNYNGSTAGAANTTSSCPMITNETTAAANLGVNYKDALFSAYPRTTSEINTIWTTNPNNGGWPSEGWSGMEFYGDKAIPGWKNSLIIGSLKWGRVLRLKLGRNGDSIMRIGGFDTASHFGSVNRYRDVAFGNSGKDLYVVMDRSTTTSGPSAANPVVPGCPGCLQKYTFLGYDSTSLGKSTIHDSIPVSWGTLNTCTPGTTITIDSTNNDLWVPITGPDGNILAEIKANGNNLGIVTTSFYTKSGAVRQYWSKRYLNRNITITPTVQPTTKVGIRLYLTRTEFNSLDADLSSGVASIGDLKILKNNDGCSPVIASNTMLINPTYTETFGDTAYVIQANINSFSSFYLGSSIITLPVELVEFNGQLQNNATHLKWITENENNTSHFVVERSIDATNFTGIGNVAAAGNSGGTLNYSLIDNNVNTLGVAIIYYRLKMVDLDGTFKYSQVITITLNDFVGRVIVSPNPASDEAKMIITTGTEGKVQWKLLDNAGRVVLNNTAQLNRGNNSVTLNLKKLAAGIYFLNVSGNGIDQVIKIQKQ